MWHPLGLVYPIWITRLMNVGDECINAPTKIVCLVSICNLSFIIRSAIMPRTPSLQDRNFFKVEPCTRNA
jgi:hypothetical protein